MPVAESVSMIALFLPFFELPVHPQCIDDTQHRQPRGIGTSFADLARDNMKLIHRDEGAGKRQLSPSIIVASYSFDWHHEVA